MRRQWLILVVLLTSCGSTEVDHRPPVVIGERKNSQGDVVERIIYEQTVTATTQPFTPEGSHRVVDSDERHYFLDVAGKPRREISNLGSDLNHCRKYFPVENSAFWVGAELDHATSGAVHGPDGHVLAYAKPLQVVTFDGQQIVAHQVFSAFWINRESEAYRLKDGNRILVFRSPKGFKQYDVRADRVSDAGPGDEVPLTGELP